MYMKKIKPRRSTMRRYGWNAESRDATGKALLISVENTRTVTAVRYRCLRWDDSSLVLMIHRRKRIVDEHDKFGTSEVVDAGRLVVPSRKILVEVIHCWWHGGGRKDWLVYPARSWKRWRGSITDAMDLGNAMECDCRRRECMVQGNENIMKGIDSRQSMCILSTGGLE